MATGDTLHGAAFVKPPAPGVVQRQKRSRSGSRSSSVFRGACGKDHDPVASKLAIWAQAFSRHTLFNRWPTNSAGKVVGGIGNRWTALRWPPSHLHQILQPMYPGLGPRNLRELEALSEIMDQLAAGQFGRAADVATQRCIAMEMAMQDGDWKRAPHLELLLFFLVDDAKLLSVSCTAKKSYVCRYLAAGLGRNWLAGKCHLATRSSLANWRMNSSLFQAPL